MVSYLGPYSILILDWFHSKIGHFDLRLGLDLTFQSKIGQILECVLRLAEILNFNLRSGVTVNEANSEWLPEIFCENVRSRQFTMN